MRIATHLCVLCTLGVLFAPGLADAQAGRPRAEITPVVERPSVHAGDKVRLALKVALPEGLHTQSDKPRDPTVIPTVMTINAPVGVTVDEIVFPPSTEFKVAGLAPLDVFEHHFAIGAQVTLAPALLAGDLVVPVRLQYQACDANLCYPPTKADVEWTLRVVAATTFVDGERDAVFASIPFGTGSKPAAPSPDGAHTPGRPAGAGANKIGRVISIRL